MEELFAGLPSGALVLPTIQSVVERLEKVERSLERRSNSLGTFTD